MQLLPSINIVQIIKKTVLVGRGPLVAEFGLSPNFASDGLIGQPGTMAMTQSSLMAQNKSHSI